MARTRTRLKTNLRAIERAFADIERSLAKLATRVRRAERQAARGPAARAVRRVGRKLRISPQRRAQLKLQGAYMGYMRQLAAKEKARVKALKEKSGFNAAIRLARKLVR